MAEAGAQGEAIPKRGMTPLQKVAMGLVIVAIDALEGYDPLPDPIGWAMVLWGLASLPLSERRTLMTTAGLAGVVSVALWFPQVNEPLREAELSLKWATSLPELLFIFLTARFLSQAAKAQAPPDTRFAGRFGVTGWATVVVGLLPPIADAAGSEQMLDYAEIGFVLLWLWLVWNLFAAHNRTYLGGAAPAETTH